MHANRLFPHHPAFKFQPTPGHVRDRDSFQRSMRTLQAISKAGLGWAGPNINTMGIRWIILTTAPIAMGPCTVDVRTQLLNSIL